MKEFYICQDGGTQKEDVAGGDPFVDLIDERVDDTFPHPLFQCRVLSSSINLDLSFWMIGTDGSGDRAADEPKTQKADR